MAKTQVSEWDTDPSLNTEIDGIDISEGCSPAGINNAIREAMSQLATLNPLGNSAIGSSIQAYSAVLGRHAAVEPTAYPTRNSANCTAAAALADGTIVVIGGILYEVDSSQTGSNSATNDLSVDGLIPHGLIMPEHYGVVADDTATNDDEPEITRALAFSASTGYPVYFGGQYRIGDTITIPLNASVFADRKASFKPTQSATVDPAIIFAAGNQLGEFQLPQFSGFSGVVVDIRCNLARIKAYQFVSCGTAFKFNTVDGNVLDSIAECEAVSASDVAVEFATPTSADVLQGCGLVTNFITNTTDAAIFTGTTGVFNDGLFLDAYAIDFTTASSGGAAADNQISGHAVPRFTLRCRSWFGGEGLVDTGSETQILKGRFDNPIVDLINSRTFDQTMIGDNDVRGARIRTVDALAIGSAVTLQETTPSLASFNSGTMLGRTWFMALATLGSDLTDGSTRDFYFYHAFADGNYYPWMCTVNHGTASGLILDYVHDQSLTEAGRVLVRLRNVSGATISSGSTKYLTLFRA